VRNKVESNIFYEGEQVKNLHQQNLRYEVGKLSIENVFCNKYLPSIF